MVIAIESYVSHNLSVLIRSCIIANSIVRGIFRLCFTAKGPFTIRGSTQALEKKTIPLYIKTLFQSFFVWL